MNKVFKSAILISVVTAFVGCSDLSNPAVDAGTSTDSGTEATTCEGCKGNSQLLAIVPKTTSYEIYPKQLVQTISGNCNDGQFPSNYIIWDMIDDNTQEIVKSSTTANVYVGKTTFVDGQSLEGVYFCKQGRFVMDVEMPNVTSAAGVGGLAGKTYTVKVYIYGIDENSKKYPASISRNYRLIPKS